MIEQERDPGKDMCPNVATVRRFWPGQPPDLVCLEHALDSREILEAMGHQLHLEPIGYHLLDKVPDPLPTCCCSAGFSQRVEIEGGSDD